MDKAKVRVMALVMAVVMVFAAVGWFAGAGEVRAVFAPPTPPPVAAGVSVGDIIPFGGHSWRVLDVDGGHALIITENIIGIRAYYNTFTDVTWATSDIRTYLNGAFFNGFSAADRARIRETNVVNNDNPQFDIPGGANTTDRIFLLSIEEVVQYFGDSGQLQNMQSGAWGISDGFDSARIAVIDDSATIPAGWWRSHGESSWWWLRSPGNLSIYAAFVYFDGTVFIGGGDVNDGGGVRPALWLNLQGAAVQATPAPAAGGASVGDVISFGGHSWRVLDVQGGYALVITENVIARRRYNNVNAAVTWANSGIRTYLNDTFFNTFGAADRARIRQTNVVNNNNPWFNTGGGMNTTDRIFLLSLEEVVQYFGDSGMAALGVNANMRTVSWPTRGVGARWIHDEFSEARIAEFNGDANWWWLRSPGSATHAATGVDRYGAVFFGGNADYANGGLRPALWLNVQDGAPSTPVPVLPVPTPIAATPPPAPGVTPAPDITETPAPVRAMFALASMARMPIAAGGASSFAVRTDGSMWSWGNNGSGRLGCGTTVNRNLPARAMENVAAVASGGGYTMAVRANGELWDWGHNANGTLGDGVSMRVAPALILTEVVSITAGCCFSMAIRTDGSLWAWGTNSWGMLGDGTTTRRLAPIQVMENVAFVSTGEHHTVAITTDGVLWAWGNNNNGQLGDGTTIQRNSPVRIMDDVIAVSSGWAHTTVIRSDGSLWAWGSNSNGQLGDGTTTRRDTPVLIMENVASVSAGVNHTMAITNDGNLWAWGANSSGQLGDGTTTQRNNPVLIMENAAAVTAGSVHTLAARTDGTLWGWGDNGSGQVGDGTTTRRLYPVLIMDNVMLPLPAVPPFDPDAPADYDYTPIDERYLFVPAPETLLRVEVEERAMEEIRNIITGLTAEQRESGDALNIATLFIENMVRRGSTQLVPEGGAITADALRDGAWMSQTILYYTDALLSEEELGLMRRLRTNVNFSSGGARRLDITFPDDVSDVEFDSVTVEAGFGAVTVNREHMRQGGQIAVQARTVEVFTDDNDDVRAAGGFFDRLFDFSSPLNILRNFWAVLAIALLVALRFILAAAGRKFRMWVIPAFAVLFIGINAVTVWSGMDDNVPHVDRTPAAQREVMEVNMSDGMRATLAVPARGGAHDFLIVFNERGEPQHSRFNPATGNIEATIRESGTYTVRENRVSFADISDKSQMMQDAVLRLAARGIMVGRDADYFYPDDEISRADFAAAIVMAFDMLDFDAQTTFTDISPNDWYYLAIATAEQAQLIEGFPDGTFQGGEPIPKSQLTLIAANTLIERMGYNVPSDVERVIARFLDRPWFEYWYVDGVALATAANVAIFRGDDLFAPDSIKTRGDAAIVLDRVFSRVW